MSRIRVFQVATGNVGTEMIKRLRHRPDLELVGLHCYTPEKIGRDAGEIAGIGPIGVSATGTVEEIIAARPDVVTFHGVFPDEDLYVTVLEAGINIVTTADWITGWHRDTNHPHPSGKPVTQLLADACRTGGATFYGTGMNPGVNQILGVVCSSDVAEIENITTLESVDVSCHHSADTWTEVGYGLSVEHTDLPDMLAKLVEAHRIPRRPTRESNWSRVAESPSGSRRSGWLYRDSQDSVVSSQNPTAPCS